VYVDESGVDDYLYHSHGWSKRGEKIYNAISGKHYQRESFVAAKCGKQILSPFCYKGTCNTELFEAWVEQILCPELQEGQVVILDNATFHKSEKTRSLIEAAQCELIFLPPYSPDLNPIEVFWANLKNKVRANLTTLSSLSDAIDAAFRLSDYQLE
jgi:transposase